MRVSAGLEESARWRRYYEVIGPAGSARCAALKALLKSRKSKIKWNARTVLLAGAVAGLDRRGVRRVRRARPARTALAGHARRVRDWRAVPDVSRARAAADGRAHAAVSRRRAIVAAGWLFVSGIVIFSGSLYLLAVTGVTVLGAITPIGGVAFLLGLGAARRRYALNRRTSMPYFWIL